MKLVLPCGLRKSKPARDMLFLSLFASHLLSGGRISNQVTDMTGTEESITNYHLQQQQPHPTTSVEDE